LWVDSGGLGLPDRDYYVKDELKDKVTAYHDHLVNAFVLLGDKPDAAAKSADAVLALETELAKATKTKVDRRDPTTMYNPMKLADLAKLAPHFDWKAYLKGRGNAKLDMVVVTSPDYFKALDGLLTSTPASTWKDYLRFNAAFGAISTTFGVSEDVSLGLPK